MLIVAQFPLADNRLFLEETAHPTYRLPFPSWPLPRPGREFIRGSGVVKERRRGGINTWPGEDAYCMAHRALKFPPRLEDIRLLDAAGNVSFLCAFRRYYSDGSAVSRVEIGLKTRINKEHFYCAIDGFRCLKIIEECLSIPVTISLPGGKSVSRRLINSGDALAHHFLYATTRKVKGRIAAVENWWMQAGLPLLLVEYRKGEIEELPKFSSEIEIGHPLTEPIHHCQMELRGKRFGVWFIRNERRGKDLLRRLRLNLFRIHAERECLKQVLRNIGTGLITPGEKPGESDLLQGYLGNAVKLLSKKNYYGLPQSRIFKVAHEADNLVSSGDRASILAQLSVIRGNLYRKLERVTAQEMKGEQPLIVLGENSVVRIGQVKISGGDTVTNYNVSFGDNNKFIGDLIVANTIQGSFNRVAESAVDREIKDKLKELHEAFAGMSDQLSQERARQAARDLETFSKEAVSPQPREKWYELSADGLIEAAETVGKMAAPVIATVKAVLALLVA